MEIHVQHSSEADTSRALDELVTQLKIKLNGQTPRFGFLFVTHHHEDHFSTLSGSLQEKLGCQDFLGCTTEAIIAEKQEHENTPGIVVWLMSDTDAEIEGFHLQFERDQNHERIECYGHPLVNSLSERPYGAVFLFCEPYSSSPHVALPQLTDGLSGIPIFGGVASGGVGPGESCLFLNGEKIDHGAVGIVYRGDHRIRPIVSQGCRPIGHTFVVTKSEKNIVYELGGRPAMAQFREMFEDLTEVDQELVRQGPFFGVVTNEYKGEFQRGDFLVSGVLGSDPESGAIAVSQPVRVGRTVQFHVRDAITADEDLKLMIEQDRKLNKEKVKGVLLFDCNGRGEGLFGHSHHDVSAIQKAYGPTPLAGCYAQGEIGPLGENSHVHGFTASIALFEQ
ncbi:FIST N-terminal domain-containing protein [Rubinisphaera sp.]|uniref:FIST signal transduction protein n=1 Tax=Rubinisphaera sp. TaxID=2024857 RepID=UPI000C0E5D38|nr:FIST N-terminal domain-containing protein [Rubinisphaera sp.]MBV08192.1 hypothetical protein [Rubinisphaera sp.]|tara:strand:+ start:1762 stop:2940 length:1179 start_codon:yes stop_codon:yes gene_type:complete